MSITFDTLPDIIIEEILSDLKYSNQVKLRYCNRRISQLLKYLVFEEVNVPEDDNDIKNMSLYIGKYVRRLGGFINKEFFDVKDEFTNLEHIRVNKYHRGDIFDQLYTLDIKLKSLNLNLIEPFPTQIQFNFNHIIKNLVELDITLWNSSKSLGVLEMLQIPNLIILKLAGYYFRQDALVIINRSFPELKELSLNFHVYEHKLALTSTVFTKLNRLYLFEPYEQYYHQFPFQSFPHLIFFSIPYYNYLGDNIKKSIKEKVFNQLIGLEIDLPKFSKEEFSSLQNLKYATITFYQSFDSQSMQHLFSLPKLSQLTLKYDIIDDLFQNLMCKSSLYSLTLKYHPKLSLHFLNFVQFNAPSLTKLIIDPGKENHAFQPNIFNGLSVQTKLNLSYLKVYKKEEEFVKWVKAQSPNVHLSYFDDDD